MKVLILIKSLLFSEALCKTLSSGANGYEVQNSRCLALASSFEPDIILADQDCLHLNKHNTWPDGKVLLLDTGLSEEEIMSLMLNHKLYGVFSLEADFQQLKKALSVIHAGQIWIDSERLKVILHGFETVRPNNTVEKLSNKENQIAELVAEGFKNKEIASKLFLSEQTIKSHLGRIFRKMHIKNRSQLVSMIIRNRVALTNHDHRTVSPD
jgi:DNA-binding NarL/FixJ family response regulator